MTKFEMVGVSFQEEAETIKHAIRAFQYSCTCCCTRGMRIDCDTCAIRHCHLQTVAAIDAAKK